jgi:hypothetical protein
MTLDRFKWLASHRYTTQQEYDNAVASYQLAMLKQGKTF